MREEVSVCYTRVGALVLVHWYSDVMMNRTSEAFISVVAMLLTVSCSLTDRAAKSSQLPSLLHTAHPLDIQVTRGLREKISKCSRLSQSLSGKKKLKEF